MLKEGNKRRKKERKEGTGGKRNFFDIRLPTKYSRKDNGVRKIPIFSNMAVAIDECIFERDMRSLLSSPLPGFG